MSLFRRILTTREKPPPPVYMRGVQLSDVVFLIDPALGGRAAAQSAVHSQASNYCGGAIRLLTEESGINNTTRFVP